MYYNSSYTYLSYVDVDSGSPGSPDLTSWVQRGGAFTTLSNAAYIKVQLRTQQSQTQDIASIRLDRLRRYHLTERAERVYSYAGSTRIAMCHSSGNNWLSRSWREMLRVSLGSEWVSIALGFG